MSVYNSLSDSRFKLYDRRGHNVFAAKSKQKPEYHYTDIPVFVHFVFITIQNFNSSFYNLPLSSFQQRNRQIIHISACGACHDQPADGFQRVI